MRLIIGSRKSDLARIQAHEVAKTLKAAHAGLQTEFFFSESLGDKNLTDPLWKMPEKGVFTEDLTRDLIDGKVDLVVHSWKDLPTEMRPQTEIVATLDRADIRDVLLLKKNKKFEDGKELRVYSSSPRRAYNLSPFFSEYLPFRPSQVKFESVRGNIPTRLRKLAEDQSVDGLIVAKAALDRLLSATADEFDEARERVKLSLQSCHWMILPLTFNPAAAAQGALALEIRKDRGDVRALLEKIANRAVFHEVESERAILRSYGGGCHQKIGISVLSRDQGEIHFLRGLTEKGEILDSKTFKGHQPSSSHYKILRSDWLFDRRPRQDFGSPPQGHGVFVSHAQAWPAGFSWEGVVWTAGLSTWKKLADQGQWVNGSAEGLGEKENRRLQAFCPDLKWAVFTHSSTKETLQGDAIFTYDLTPKKEAEKPSENGLYWTSPALVEEALSRWPDLKDRRHAAGPGKTFECLRKLGLSPEICFPGQEKK